MTNDELRTRLAKIKNGDKAAFQQLYDDMKTPIYTVIFRTTRVKADADEIMQELFLKLFQSPPFDVENPRAYIFKVARNMSLDALRKRESVVQLDDELVMRLPAPNTTGKRLEVEEALDALPPEQSQVVSLHLNGGFKFREIAEIVGAPLGTVLWRYNKAVSVLRDLLAGEGV